MFMSINTAHEDNEDSSLLSSYASGTLLVFGSEETKTLTTYSSVVSGLKQARTELKPE